jgi:formylglycine-generating enzyme required for sulfatase activity/serine/threonine protein kinase
MLCDKCNAEMILVPAGYHCKYCDLQSSSEEPPGKYETAPPREREEIKAVAGSIEKRDSKNHSVSRDRNEQQSSLFDSSLLDSVTAPPSMDTRQENNSQRDSAFSHVKDIAPAEGLVKQFSAEPSVDFSDRPISDADQLLDNRYRLGKQLGEGGVGTVFLALDTRANREVAIKKVKLKDSQSGSTAVEEACALARLQHEGIVDFQDAFYSVPYVYIAMEYFPSIDLRTWVFENLKRGIPSLVEISSIIEGISQPLSHMHVSGINHCDIKPANILIDHQRQIKLIDLGFSRTQSLRRAIKGGGGFGTPGFSAPEQIAYAQDSVQADIYSFGAVLYFLLSGGEEPGQAYIDIEKVKLVHFQEVLRKALHRQKGQRYQTVVEFVDHLKRILKTLRTSGSGKSGPKRNHIPPGEKFTTAHKAKAEPKICNEQKTTNSVPGQRNAKELSLSLHRRVNTCDFIEAYSDMHELISNHEADPISKGLVSDELRINGLSRGDLERCYKDAIAARALFEEAESALNLGEMERALKHFKEILQEYPADKLALELIEGRRVVKGFTYKALELVVDSNTRAAELFENAEDKVGAGDLPQALELLEEIVQLKATGLSKSLLNGDIRIAEWKLIDLRTRVQETENFKNKLLDLETAIERKDYTSSLEEVDALLDIYSHLNEAKLIHEGRLRIGSLDYDSLHARAAKQYEEKAAEELLEGIHVALRDHAWTKAWNQLQSLLGDYGNTAVAESLQGDAVLISQLTKHGMNALYLIESETKRVLDEAVNLLEEKAYKEALGMITQRLSSDQNSAFAREISEGGDICTGWSLPRLQSHVQRVHEVEIALVDVEKQIDESRIFEAFHAWEDICEMYGDLESVSDLISGKSTLGGLKISEIQQSYSEYIECSKAVEEAGKVLAKGDLIGAFEILQELHQARPEHMVLRDLLSGAKKIGNFTFHSLSKEVEAIDKKARQEQQQILARVKISQAKEVICPGALQRFGGINFVWCPPGEFLMGLDGLEANTEAGCLKHRVFITKGFWISTTPVTQNQWCKVMGSRVGNFQGMLSGNRPVEMINWHDACAFTRQFGESTSDPNFRLPTEAEWEYVCRANTLTRWFFGSAHADLPKYAWTDSCSGKKTQSVGKLKPNPWGLYDLYGNVWEWVQDWASPKTGDTEFDPTGPQSGKKKLARGGSWFDNHMGADSMKRVGFFPDTRDSIIGLRIVRNS